MRKIKKLLKTLKRTQGAWKDDKWNKVEAKRRKVEIEAVKKMKKPW